MIAAPLRFSPAGAAAMAALMLAVSSAQTPAPASGEDPYASLPPARAAVERMLSERAGPAQLETAIAAARKLGATPQAELEARFLFHVDRREDEKISALLPKFEERAKAFRIEDSEIFAVKEDWLAVVEYVRALDALGKKDREGFKKHITEAFWLSPRQGSAFAPHIDRLRLEEAMRELKIGGDITLDSLTGGAPVSFASLNEGKKAMLLHFWSPWSRECEESMPDFRATAATLEKHGIAVVSVLAESGPDARKDASAMMTGDGKDKPPGAWLVDREQHPLIRMLRIQDLPAMALVSPAGEVLFNGHPAEDGLWQALSRLAPDVRRPAMPGH